MQILFIPYIMASRNCESVCSENRDSPWECTRDISVQMKKFNLTANSTTKPGFHRKIPGFMRYVSDAEMFSILEI
jgi:hypothetical protein